VSSRKEDRNESMRCLPLSSIKIGVKLYEAADLVVGYMVVNVVVHEGRKESFEASEFSSLSAVDARLISVKRFAILELVWRLNSFRKRLSLSGRTLLRALKQTQQRRAPFSDKFRVHTVHPFPQGKGRLAACTATLG
jgi:hypothetical protein